jgi:hypothetical protein
MRFGDSTSRAALWLTVIDHRPPFPTVDRLYQSMKIGRTGNLYFLAFDHRGALYKQLVDALRTTSTAS